MLNRLEEFDSQNLQQYITPPRIRLIGVGGAGNNILRRLHRRPLPGDRFVLCAATASQREVAFEACAFLMDWLKTKAPFWKREEIDGKSSWVAARQDDEDAAARWQTDEQSG